LSGTIGGATQSVFRGKRSIEEKLSEFTTYLAVAFVVLSIAISFWGFK
jgi:protein translocase SecG subunit